MMSFGAFGCLFPQKTFPEMANGHGGGKLFVRYSPHSILYAGRVPPTLEGSRPPTHFMTNPGGGRLSIMCGLKSGGRDAPEKGIQDFKCIVQLPQVSACFFGLCTLILSSTS